jgi:hypothetical protein
MARWYSLAVRIKTGSIKYQLGDKKGAVSDWRKAAKIERQQGQVNYPTFKYYKVPKNQVQQLLRLVFVEGQIGCAKLERVFVDRVHLAMPSSKLDRSTKDRSPPGSLAWVYGET